MLEPTRKCNGSNPSQDGSAELQQIQLRHHSLTLAERRWNDEQHDTVCKEIAAKEIGRHLSDESHSYEQMTGRYDFPDHSNFTTSQTNKYPYSSAIKFSLNVENPLASSEPQVSSSLPADSFHTALSQCHSSPPMVTPANEQFLATIYSLERRDSSVPANSIQKEAVAEKSDDEEDYFADAQELREIRSSIRKTNH